MRHDSSDDPDPGKAVGSIESAKRAIKRMLQDQDLSEERTTELEELHNELEKRESEVRETEQSLQEHKEELSELRSQVNAYEEKFDEVREPPLLYGHVLRLRGGQIVNDERRREEEAQAVA